MSMGWLYFGLMLVQVTLMLGQLFFIINYSDLESDYTTPYSLCELMDRVYPIEVYAQGAVTLVLLLCREWASVLLLGPVTGYNAWRYGKMKFKFDATTIFRELSTLKAEAFAKLAYYILMFCWLLYSMIWWLIVSHDSM